MENRRQKKEIEIETEKKKTEEESVYLTWHISRTAIKVEAVISAMSCHGAGKREMKKEP